MRRTVLSVLALLCVGLAVPQTAAQADTTTDVGLTGFADLVVDQAHGHVFISQGTANVVVTDLSGTPVGTLTGLAGADGMTLSADGSELYIALSGADAIAQVSTADPFGTAVTTFPTGLGTCPLDVAYSAGLVWFDATCDGQWANLYPLDPTTGDVSDVGSHLVYNSRLYASPSLPDTVFASDIGSSPASLYEFTVSGGNNPSVSEQSLFGVNESASYAVSNDGSQVVTGGHQSFSTTDLAALQSYAVPKSSSAVAMRTSDQLLAFGSGAGVVFYPLGSSTPMGTYKFDDLGARVVDGGLAFGTTKLYAVTYDSQATPGYTLHVITPRNRPRADLSIDVSGSHYRYGKKATVTVTLHHHRSNAQLRIFAVTPDGKLYYLKHGKPDSHGQLHLRLAMTVNATFIGTFDGDYAKAAQGVGTRVRVAALVIGKLFNAKRHVKGYALYKPSQKAVFATAVGPKKKGECVYFRAQFRLHGRWGHTATTSCIVLDRNSNAAVYLQGSSRLAGIPIRIRSEWTGDSFNKSARSTWHYLKFTGAARSASARTGSAFPTLHAAPVTQVGTPKIRTPFSQQTARSHWSPSSKRLNPLSWLS